MTKSQWQLIETAHKDETSIMTYPNYVVCHWNGFGWASRYIGNGNEVDSQHDWEYANPTHWEPLSTPPKDYKG